jgi:hypothetical protein
MECDKCINEGRIVLLEEGMKKNSETHEKFYGNFEILRTKDAVREERDKSIDNSLNMIMTSQGELKAIVMEVQSRPFKQAEKQVSTIKDKVLDKAVNFILIAVAWYVLSMVK